MEGIATKPTFQKYPTYKDSGVEWLGEIPEHWDEVPLCSLTKLKSITNCIELKLLSVYLDFGVIKFSEVEAKRTNVTSQDLSKYQRVDIGDFVLNNQQAWRGSVGVSNHLGIVSPAYLVLGLSNKLHTGYSNYMFRSGYMTGQYLINSKGVGTIQRNLYWPSLRRAKVIVPPLPEQTAIAAFLDDKTAKIDRTIAQKEKMIALLKERKQIIIQNAVTKGLTPNAKMKDSGVEWIGEIPEGWEVKRLKHVGKIKSGEAIVNNELTDNGAYEVFGGNGLMGYTDKHNVEGEKIIIGRVGALCGNIRYSCSKRWISDNALIFTLNKKEGYHFISVLLEAANLNTLNTSNAQPLITGTKVLNFEIPYPTINEQTSIVAYIETQSAKIDKAISLQEQQIEKLKEYKTILIDNAVTGKIKVS